MLTTGIDNLAGTANDDTFIGDQAVTSAADQVTGSAGNDTFKLFTTGAVTLPTLSGVENVWIQGAAADVDVSSQADVTSVELSKLSMAAARSVNVTAAQKLTVSDTTATGNTLTLANNTATAQSVAVSKTGDATNALDIDVDGDAVTTLNIEATGASFVDVDNTGTKLATVNVAGSADLTIENVEMAKTIAVTNSAKTTLSTAVDKVTVTGAAGAETVNLTHATGTAREFSVSTGAGDDKVALTNLAVAADLTDSKVTISGGEGSDTLAMKSALGNALSGLTAANVAKKGIANDFEVLEITDQGAAADDVNLARLGSNITKVDYAAGLGAAQTLQGLATGGTVVLGAAASAAADSLTVSVKDAAVAGNNSDVLNITLDGSHAAGTLDYGVLTAASVETINVNSTSTKKTALVAADKNEIDLTVANAQTVNVTGNVYADLDGAALTGASLATIDASANTAGVAVSVVGAAQGISITGTAMADAIVGGSGADKIIAGAGNDVVTGGLGNDIIDISGGGSNTIKFLAAASTNGTDAITGFNVGATAAGGDVLSVSDFADITATTISANLTNLTGSQAVADDSIYTLNFNSAINGKDFSAADFAELFAAAGKPFSTTTAADAESVILVQGTDETHMYYVDSGADATATDITAADVNQIGVLGGVTNANTFLDANVA